MATNQDAAFGLRPIGKVGQNRDAQGLSEYSIAASTSSAIYQNDPVKAASTGAIDVAAAGDTLCVGSTAGRASIYANTDVVPIIAISAEADTANVATVFVIKQF